MILFPIVKSIYDCVNEQRPQVGLYSGFVWKLAKDLFQEKAILYTEIPASIPFLIKRFELIDRNSESYEIKVIYVAGIIGLLWADRFSDHPAAKVFSVFSAMTGEVSFFSFVLSKNIFQF